jgi:flagellar hook-basal body complex protein FliE
VPIDPTLLVSGPEWSVGKVAAPADPSATGAVSGSGASGFGQMLAGQLGQLSSLQDQAAQSAQALATGQATDPTKVVMDVERARLSMQLASQLRTKATDAMNEIFHTQV